MRSVPAGVRNDLATLAEQAGLSLSQYLNQQLAFLARLAHLSEAFARLHTDAGSRPAIDEIIDDLRELRNR